MRVHLARDRFPWARLSTWTKPMRVASSRRGYYANTISPKLHKQTNDNSRT